MNNVTAEQADQSLPQDLSRVHMVGIGGAGMSGLARILLARGGQVSGSDAKESRGVIDLRTRGAKIHIGHDPAALELLDGGPTVVVTTLAAIPKTNPELVAARERGIPVLLRPAVLATLMEGYTNLLIAGTHGKTSTTSMTVVALQHCGFNPSFAVGGELNESGTNAHHGSGGVFVAEADESDGSLLQYSPTVAVVTNVESDHLDYFGTTEAYVQVFDDFADRIRPGGSLIVCLDDPGSAALAGRVAVRLAERGVAVLGYGEGVHSELAGGLEPIARLLSWQSKDGGGLARIRFADPAGDGIDSTEHTIALTVPGKHMALNAVAALVAGVCAGAPVAEVIEGLEGFAGVHRRFQLRGRIGRIRVYDDYAHHPTEVRAVLTAARDMVDADGGRVLAVFQPHLYSRTETFATEFAAALDLADQVIVLDVYGAREQPIPGVSGFTIAEKVTKPVAYQPDVSALPDQVAQLVEPDDVVLTIGAGDVTMQAPEIVDVLRAASRAPRGDTDPSSGGRR
ncbi:UDP-N-acetylmuramate--L-alanine ligase [Williamsia sp. 1138]|uniref:UDP-N-acetylmuramate--L-alanine ligase n=1 Tax=Williamsia sp. 1138 TaxID=1903117 RepID=UPI000A11E0A5|nr:UDP-N-acetylmuramate--L-alanine ligase [Williamsia sp. 1138]OZG28331.1 UDP-N-acetylmuramate--L-alanine ligase [Williamsia sp. 1138]